LCVCEGLCCDSVCLCVCEGLCCDCVCVVVCVCVCGYMYVSTEVCKIQKWYWVLWLY